MNGFKLLAIRTPSECFFKGKDALKVLKPNTVFPFYNMYHYPSNNFEKIGYIPENNLDIYNVLGKISVNISVIVGENGTGKSTLIELLLMAMYNLGALTGVLKKCDCKKNDDNCDCAEIKNWSEVLVAKDFKLEILYTSHEEELICLKFENGEINPFKYSRKQEDFIRNKSPDLIGEFTRSNLQDFCYSILVNYSHHALNENEIGRWVSLLFHKNDGYQTPVVINPWRSEGNIEINRENELLKDRLLSNLLEPISGDSKKSLRNLANNKIAESLTLTLDQYKIAKAWYKEWDDSLSDSRNKGNAILFALGRFGEIQRHGVSFNNINAAFEFDIEGLDFENNEIYKWVVLYMLGKSNDILKKYPTYSDKEISNNPYNLLRYDISHIAFKWKRAFYFLKYYKYWQPIIDSKDSVSLNDVAKVIQDIKKLEIADYKQRKDKRKDNKLKAYTFQTLEFLPPSFFSIDINLSNGLTFSQLSSGERQKIHGISSVVYHLINLNSIVQRRLKNGELFVAYRNVNIILDEIELYYHPEWQRVFINDLLEYLKKINPKHTRKIEGINFQLVTHSPFILSDIPQANILFLQKENSKLALSKSIPRPYSDSSRTFGANIHRLLADDFFMSDGFIGAFAKKKIQQVIDDLRDKKVKGRRKLQDQEMWESIQLIGEPFLREKLKTMFLSKKNNPELLEHELDKAKAEVKRLEELKINKKG